MINDIFVTCAKKDWRTSSDEYFKLHERRQLLNDRFVFTDDIIQRFRDLNLFLIDEEHRIRKRVTQIHQQQEKMLDDKIIDDYEIRTELCFWNFSGYYAALDEDTFDGNPFYTDYSFSQYVQGDEFECFFTDKWNDLLPTHPLGNIFFCHTFHAIYDHTPLAWEDILRIEELDMCLEVTNHFESKIKDRFK